MSTKPKAVRDAEENANKLLKELNTPPDPNAPPEPPATPPDPNAPPVIDPNAPPVPPVEPPAPVTPPSEDFQAKYQTLQGKYNAEVPVLYNEIGDLKVKLAEALSMINELQKAPVAPATPATPVAPPEGLTYMRKEMPGMEDAVRFIVKEESTKIVQDLVGKKVGEVGEKLNNLEASTAKNAGNAFYNDLNAKVPNWEVINENPEFLQWLNGVEPYTGYKKMDLLQNAHANMDAPRVAKFFLDFIAELEAKKKGAPKPNDPAKFVAPPKPAGGGGEPASPGVEDFVTSAEIQKFYNDVALGKYKNREQERAAMEGKINKAMAEGKIR